MARHFHSLPVLLYLSLAFLITGCETTDRASAPTDSQDFPFLEYTVDQFREGYRNGDFTVTEVVQAYLDRIETMDQAGPGLNSILAVNPDALEIAAVLDQELADGEPRGPLHGIVVALKDNLDTHDKMPTTAGSRALANSFPLQDSYVAARLREAGAVIIGKANLSEWANFRGEPSSSGWSGVGGQTRNPYDLSRNPCGSSSGSGAAVSGNMATLAIGTETNGSIVCPAHANGIVGVKPTVGLVSRSGVVPISFTQDTPGPMARTVRDAAICLGAIVGVDSSDTKTLASKDHFLTDYTPFLRKDGLQGKRIGLFTGPRGRNYKVDSLTARAVRDLRAAGAQVVEIDQISRGNMGNYSFNIMLYEYKDGLNQYFTALGPGAPVKNLEELIAFNLGDSIELRYYNQRYLELAQEKGPLTEEEYLDAIEKMRIGTQDEGIDRVMEENNLDAIMAPTGGPAWKTDWTNGDSFGLGSSSPAARAGYPNITVPMGYVDHLPVGLSFFGKAWTEPLLLEITYAYEQATKHRRAPEFLVGK